MLTFVAIWIAGVLFTTFIQGILDDGTEEDLDYTFMFFLWWVVLGFLIMKGAYSLGEWYRKILEKND